MGRRGRVCFVVMLVMNLWVNIASPGRVVERLQDGFGYYYMIKDYALGDPADYQLQPVTTACQCRYWCQTSVVCHSVSVVNKVDGGVQCRVSNKPTDLTDKGGRPRLIKTQGAVHFLETASTAWEDLGYSGFKFMNTMFPFLWTFCPGTCSTFSSCVRRPCSMATITDQNLLRDAKEYTTASYKYNIYLDRPSGGGVEPLWGVDRDPHYSTGIANLTLLDPSTLAGSGTKFYMKHTGSGSMVVFYASGSSFSKCLCMDNPLNMET